MLSGSTSGEAYRPRKLRTFDYSTLRPIETLGSRAVSTRTASCPRWLVTTTINPATPNLQAFAKLEDWCKVFVLDKKSPPDFALSGPGVVVLNVADQEALPYRLARLLPWNHFGRKNLGYLYALMHGAEVIYDTDDDNFIETNPLNETLLPTSLDLSKGEVHLVPHTADGAFNPYPFWGADDAWPRGFPLSRVTTVTARTGAVRTPADVVAAAGQRTCMLQSLANVDPDMDAIFRLTRPLPLFFPVMGTRLIYPPEVYAPANAQATLLSKDVAAAMLMPVTVHGRVSDIWRSYILQRVMWDSGCRLTFADPWVKQYRNAHGYLKDFQAELDLYLKTEGVLQVLNEIDFGSETALGPRVLTTFARLYDYGIVEELDVKQAYAYLRDLNLIDPVPSSGRGSPATTTTSKVADSAEAPSTTPQPRAVVCVTGLFRGGPFTFSLLRTSVFEALGMPFDTVLVTPSDEEDGQQASGGHASDFAYLLPNLKAVVHPDYSNVSALVAHLDWSRTALKEGDVHNPTDFVKHLTDLSACNDAIRRTGVEYSYAVRARGDALVMDRLPLPPAELTPKRVVVPDNEEYQGVNNRFAYGRIEDMTVLFNQLGALPALLPRAPDAADPKWNAEQIYAVHAADNGIAFDKRPIQLCRFLAFEGGVLVMDPHDARTYPVCSSYCADLKGCRYD